MQQWNNTIPSKINGLENVFSGWSAYTSISVSMFLLILDVHTIFSGRYGREASVSKT